MAQSLKALLLALILSSAATPSEKDSYQLVGMIMREDGKPFAHVRADIFLTGAITPYSAQAEAAADGGFKFKNLPAATYTLLVAVPRAGEIRKTIEVGPAFADSKRRVRITVTFAGAGTGERNRVVTAVELSIPDGARLEYSRANECLSRRDIKGAESCLRRAVEIAPRFAAAWNFLGTISYQTRQYLQAETYFREALKQDPELFSPLVNLGGALLSQGKIEESLPVNERAVKAQPDDALAHSQLGQSFFFLERLDEAENHLKQAKALDPGHFSLPQLYLAEIYAQKKQIQAAISELEELLRLHPDSDQAPKVKNAINSLRERLQKKPPL
jgi:tetratricopeptide (TPR) repeat protein